MSQRSANTTVSVLRWTLALIVLWESLRFAFSAAATRHFITTGLPHWIRPAIAGTEIVAALLFLIPRTVLIGSRLLLFVFAVAAIIHVLHRDFDISGLILYSVCVIVCMAHRNLQSVEASREQSSH